MLSYAEKEEKHSEREKIEKQLFPLWLVHYTMAKISGTDIIDYNKFIEQTLSDGNDALIHKQAARTAEDIISEFMPFVEADRQRGGGG